MVLPYLRSLRTQLSLISLYVCIRLCTRSSDLTRGSASQEKAVVHEWFAGCEMPALPKFHLCGLLADTHDIDRTEEVRRLGMGPLLSDLSRKMQIKADQGAADPAKILIHSTHDTCLAGLSSTLEIFDEKYVAHGPAEAQRHLNS